MRQLDPSLALSVVNRVTNSKANPGSNPNMAHLKVNNLNTAHPLKAHVGSHFQPLFI